jgi:predicted RNA-binding protein associated with RNAse of E/G family
MGGSTTTPIGSARRRPGDAVAIRELWNGRVWYARPAVVVTDDPALRMFHVPAHVRCRIPIDARGDPLRIPTDDWTLADEERGAGWNLSFAFPETAYAVILPFHGTTNELLGYYVNLQSPLTPSAVGFDTVDHLLDVTIPADRSSWAWKDEDELAVAIERGLFTAEDAASFRSWGERAVEHVLRPEPPFDRDWSDWRPDPSWATPFLSLGWDEVATRRPS